MSGVIYVGDALSELRAMEDGEAQVCVTSPPYYRLRDYGHDRQIGQEQTPETYVSRLTAVFREVRRVLQPNGTLWLNLGDSYAGTAPKRGHADPKNRDGRNGSSTRGLNGLKDKDLLGMPWEVALALRRDGWYLRDCVIWAKGFSGEARKGRVMPSSVKDRTVTSHEYLFLLTKSPRYFYDAEEIAEPLAESTLRSMESAYKGRSKKDYESNGVQDPSNVKRSVLDGILRKQGLRPQAIRAFQIAREANLSLAHLQAVKSVGINDVGKALISSTGAGRNTDQVQQLADDAKQILGGYFREFAGKQGDILRKLLFPTQAANAGDFMGTRRSVWFYQTSTFKGAHFATYPRKLIEPCIKACSLKGDVVLDPFFGAGTTGLAAEGLKRNWVGVELNQDYADLAARRIQEEMPGTRIALA